MVSITNKVRVTRSGRVFNPIFPKDVEGAPVGKKAKVPTVDPISAPFFQYGESSRLKANDDDYVLRLIRRSEFNILEQLL